MKTYKSKYDIITGSTRDEIIPKARKIYNEIAKTTKRNPYIRSAYFKKEKVFLKMFWEHLFQKSAGERTRRARYYQAALDLIRNTKCEPDIVKIDSETRYRFYGQTTLGANFVVQIKQNRRNNKYHMSVFPPRHKK
jgi:hypothetical protein